MNNFPTFKISSSLPRRGHENMYGDFVTEKGGGLGDRTMEPSKKQAIALNMLHCNKLFDNSKGIPSH